MILAISGIVALGALGRSASGKNDGSPDTVGADNDVITIETKIAPGGYPPIVVEVGTSVRINFKAESADLNSCNNELIIPEWNICKKLTIGDNFVEFTPTKTGTFGYSCWMNMIRSTITVIEQGSGDDVGAFPLDESANTSKGCGMMNGSGSSESGSCCGGR